MRQPDLPYDVHRPLPTRLDVRPSLMPRIRVARSFAFLSRSSDGRRRSSDGRWRTRATVSSAARRDARSEAKSREMAWSKDRLGVGFEASGMGCDKGFRARSRTYPSRFRWAYTCVSADV